MLANLPQVPLRQRGRRGRILRQSDPPSLAVQPNLSLSNGPQPAAPAVILPGNMPMVPVPVVQPNLNLNRGLQPGAPAMTVQGNMPLAPVPIAHATADAPVMPPVPPAVPGNAPVRVPHTNLPEAYLPVVETHRRYKKMNLGLMNIECRKCYALHWLDEKHSKSTQTNPTFGACRLDGKIKLPMLEKPPRELRELYDGSSYHSDHFLKHIVAYNNAFAMVSVAHKQVHFDTPGPDVYTIEGELRYRMGSLLPSNNQPLYSQVYFQTNEMALDIRMGRTAYVDQNTADNQAENATRHGQGRREILQILHDVLHQNHGYIALYKTALERLQEAGTPPDIHVYLHFDPKKDQRTYNLPTADEVAVIIPGNGQQATTGHDLILATRGGPLQRISEIHPAFQSLYYVLLFPRGEHGWHTAIPLNLRENENFNLPGYHEGEMRHAGEEADDDENPQQHSRRKSRKTVSQLEYYAYRLHTQRNESNHLFRARALFQRYIVDGWAQTDQSRLSWLENNQNELRVDVLQGFVDAVATHGDANLAEIGQRVILPSSYIGGSRHMFQLYQDSLALARFFAKPDFFLTVTANPRWEEITQELLPGQQPSDCPDLIARVFQEKIRKLIKKIKDGLLGGFCGNVYTIEFQKRGLPHIHILIFLN